MDIGGSSSRARLRDGERGTVDADGPGANVAALDAAVVDSRLSALVGELGDIHPVACCAGAAGAELPAGRARLQDILARLLPDCRLSIVHDARLVLAAAAMDSGIALIAGTGSVAYGRSPDGREAQRGGWGWMLGDEGGGVWIAREAARLVISREEDGLDLGALGTEVLAATGARDARGLIANLHDRREPMAWAALARTVFDSQEADAGARDIIRRAGVELAKLAVEVRGILGHDPTVVFAGGLLLNQPRLEAAVRDALPHVDCIRLEEPPVEGAVRLAEELLRT